MSRTKILILSDTGVARHACAIDSVVFVYLRGLQTALTALPMPAPRAERVAGRYPLNVQSRFLGLARQLFLCDSAFTRTTIDLPDPLFRQVKSLAALKGSTLRAFIADALQWAVASGEGQRRHKVRLPLIRSKQPGALRLANADIEDQLARH